MATLTFTKDITLLIPTRNRPHYINYLLTTFDTFGFFQRSELEIIVIDGNASDETREVAAKFPVKCVDARGLCKSPAMNKALDFAEGEFIAFIDDDVVILDPQWLDKLRNNFTDNKIGYVGGRIIAYKTDTLAERMWEEKGGLDKGSKEGVYGEQFFKKIRINGVPVRRFSIGASHMMRRTVLDKIGAHDERWGPGSKINGAGTDLDLGYKVLKYGYTAVYEPNSVLAHRHSETEEELRARLFDYGITDTAIHTKFVVEYGDWRSLGELLYRPLQQTFWLIKSLVGKYPLRADFILASVLGNLIGPTVYFIYAFPQKSRSRKKESTIV
ncbi:MULTISPECIES: glycosyltransferase [unclassified Microcoleus]|uniref:glycosyltransferase n=1 Tax=unclassified Microcoleus TaxID=2642155 RepID=UPI002FD3EF85